jgi:hypothetical protein
MCTRACVCTDTTPRCDVLLILPATPGFGNLVVYASYKGVLTYTPNIPDMRFVNSTLVLLACLLSYTAVSPVAQHTFSYSGPSVTLTRNTRYWLTFFCNQLVYTHRSDAPLYHHRHLCFSSRSLAFFFPISHSCGTNPQFCSPNVTTSYYAFGENHTIVTGTSLHCQSPARALALYIHLPICICGSLAADPKDFISLTKTEDRIRSMYVTVVGGTYPYLCLKRIRPP